MHYVLNLKCNIYTIFYVIYIINLSTKSESFIIIFEDNVFLILVFPTLKYSVTQRRYSIKYEDSGVIIKLLPEKLLEFVLYQISFIKTNSTENQGHISLAKRMLPQLQHS